MSSALTKRLKDSLATRPEIQITHTRGGRQSLAPVDINTVTTPYFVLKKDIFHFSFKFRQFRLRLVNENNACKLAFARVEPKGIDVNRSKRLSPTPSVSNLNLRP